MDAGLARAQKRKEYKRKYEQRLRDEYHRLKNNPGAEPSFSYHSKKYSGLVEAYEARLARIRIHNMRRRLKPKSIE